MRIAPIDLPTLIVLLTVCVYWTIVGAKVIRRRRATRKLSGVVPEQSLETVMALIWVPLVVAWFVLPWCALTHASGVLALPAFAGWPVYMTLRWMAAAAGIAALYGSIRAWRQMGKHWTIAVTHDETSKLFTGGMFGRIRHPIYALSIVLMIATLAVVPTWPMLVVAVIHLTLMVIKARNEERFLLAAHGEAYARYCRDTGRFVPHAAAARPR